MNEGIKRKENTGSEGVEVSREGKDDWEGRKSGRNESWSKESEEKREQEGMGRNDGKKLGRNGGNMLRRNGGNMSGRRGKGE